MKVSQEREVFKPITIVLETESEAKALFDLFDRTDLPELNSAQKELIGNLSDARTIMKVRI